MGTVTTRLRGSRPFGHRVKRRRTRNHKAVKSVAVREERLRRQGVKMMAHNKRLLEINSVDQHAT